MLWYFIVGVVKYINCYYLISVSIFIRDIDNIYSIEDVSSRSNQSTDADTHSLCILLDSETIDVELCIESATVLLKLSSQAMSDHLKLRLIQAVILRLKKTNAVTIDTLTDCISVVSGLYKDKDTDFLIFLLEMLPRYIEAKGKCYTEYRDVIITFCNNCKRWDKPEELFSAIEQFCNNCGFWGSEDSCLGADQVLSHIFLGIMSSCSNHYETKYRELYYQLCDVSLLKVTRGAATISPLRYSLYCFLLSSIISFCCFYIFGNKSNIRLALAVFSPCIITACACIISHVLSRLYSVESCDLNKLENPTKLQEVISVENFISDDQKLLLTQPY